MFSTHHESYNRQENNVAYPVPFYQIQIQTRIPRSDSEKIESGFYFIILNIKKKHFYFAFPTWFWYLQTLNSRKKFRFPNTHLTIFHEKNIIKGTFCRLRIQIQMNQNDRIRIRSSLIKSVTLPVWITSTIAGPSVSWWYSFTQTNELHFCSWGPLDRNMYLNKYVHLFFCRYSVCSLKNFICSLGSSWWKNSFPGKFFLSPH